ncbi:MAG TPA: 16S rRNA (cytosine(1402)-N(4))-methyltransferase RsmH [Anaerolineae bacterium]|jgi:16S rRNA (cytosine1402-N4)-methyltransferase
MHISVLYQEVLAALQPHSGGRYLDATVGGGGHTEGLLLASGPDGVVLGTDADAEAIVRAAERLKQFGQRVVLRQSWLDQATELARSLGFEAFDGILSDLGLSSNQLDNPERGFSFMKDGPLDMRFDSSRGPSAAELVNQSDVAALTALLQEYGEVQRARRVAEVIWSARPIKTTHQLRDVVAAEARSRGPIHPATQVFQALRIAVNEELRRLSIALPQLAAALAPDGRLAVITFHSLEDRIVKTAFRDLSVVQETQPGFGLPIPVSRRQYRLVTKKPIKPGDAEVSGNPRARSAKLRVIERMA